MAKTMMNVLRVSKNTWHPAKGSVDTTTSSYWLNWRFFLCCLWIITSMAVALCIIVKHERPGNHRRTRNGEEADDDVDDYGVVYDEDVWKPCLEGIHPVWLMAFKIIAFFVLLYILIRNAIDYGGIIFYYYRDLTFTLLIIYFGFGSLMSMYGCYHQHIRPEDRRHPRQVSGFWGYSFQIMFQMVAGAVVLTDCVFWFTIVPILARKDSQNLESLTIALHSTNVVFLLGDTALNSLRFPWFRIAYFVLWTCVFVVFQWVVHVCIYLWWPYTFLDLSSSLSPLWYISVALLHLPCYGVFFLIIKLFKVAAESTYIGRLLSFITNSWRKGPKTLPRTTFLIHIFLSQEPIQIVLARSFQKIKFKLIIITHEYIVRLVGIFVFEARYVAESGAKRRRRPVMVVGELCGELMWWASDEKGERAHVLGKKKWGWGLGESFNDVGLFQNPSNVF